MFEAAAKKLDALIRRAGMVLQFAIPVAIGAAIVYFPTHGGDRITLHESQGEDSGAILARVNRYCYTRTADERTCRLYLRELVSYSYDNEDLFQTARQRLAAKLPGDNTTQAQPETSYRATVDPLTNHHNLPQFGRIAKTLARVVDTNAQASGIGQ